MCSAGGGCSFGVIQWVGCWLADSEAVQATHRPHPPATRSPVTVNIVSPFLRLFFAVNVNRLRQRIRITCVVCVKHITESFIVIKWVVCACIPYGGCFSNWRMWCGVNLAMGAAGEEWVFKFAWIAWIIRIEGEQFFDFVDVYIVWSAKWAGFQFHNYFLLNTFLKCGWIIFQDLIYPLDWSIRWRCFGAI